MRRPAALQLAELTTDQVDALDRTTPAVLPFAAIEQHGPHLPLATDTLIAEGVLRRLDARDPERALCLPVQRFGSSPHHLPFRGTVTLSSRTFLDVALELASSLRAHGFTNLLLLNAHGGNRALLDVAVQEIRLGGRRRIAGTAEGRATRVVHATYWTLAAEGFCAIRESPAGGLGHAGEMETSVMLALHPGLVKIERAAPGGRRGRSTWDERDMLAPGRVGQFRYFDEMTETGPVGDPTTATAAKGERFLEAAVDALMELLDDLRAGRIG